LGLSHSYSDHQDTGVQITEILVCGKPQRCIRTPRYWYRLSRYWYADYQDSVVQIARMLVSGLPWDTGIQNTESTKIVVLDFQHTSIQNTEILLSELQNFWCAGYQDLDFGFSWYRWAKSGIRITEILLAYFYDSSVCLSKMLIAEITRHWYTDFSVEAFGLPNNCIPDYHYIAIWKKKWTWILKLLMFKVIHRLATDIAKLLGQSATRLGLNMTLHGENEN
jgi:hypothetical protein